MESCGLIFGIFSLIKGVKLPRKKKVFFPSKYCLTSRVFLVSVLLSPCFVSRMQGFWLLKTTTHSSQFRCWCWSQQRNRHKPARFFFLNIIFFQSRIVTCPYIKEGDEIKVNHQSSWKIMKRVTCESYNIIYILDCEKCGKKYIGSTTRQLKHRVAEHKGYISNQVTSRATGAHWNLPGHSLALKVTVLEQSKSRDEEYIREREKYFIRKFDTFNDGINREWWGKGRLLSWIVKARCDETLFLNIMPYIWLKTMGKILAQLIRPYRGHLFMLEGTIR